MYFILGTLLFALVVLAIWGGILWVGARLDAPHLERERLEREFGEEEN